MVSYIKFVLYNMENLLIELCDWVIEFNCQIRDTYSIWDLISEWNIILMYLYRDDLYKNVFIKPNISND